MPAEAAVWVFMTMGPYQATGSWSGFPETSRNRMPSSPACTMTSSPRSKSTSDRFSACAGGVVSSQPTGFGGHRQRAGCVAELPGARENVSKGVARGLDRKSLPPAGRHRHIEVDRVGGDPVHRALLAPEASADDAHLGAVIVLDHGDIPRLHLLVARRGHFERRRKVRPQLEAVHAAGRIALGHFLVDDAAAGRHPLHVAGGR